MFKIITPKVSIIVPVYNVEKYIHDCINSILNQSLSDFELILVNDGSKDNSGQICDEFAKKDNRIIVIHKNNGGLSSARNAGIDAAKGEYIGFVDSDDWIDKDMYEILYDNIVKYNAQIAACNLCIMKRNNEFIPSPVDERDIIFSTEEAMAELISNQKLTFSACNKLFSKSLFQELRYREGIILEDMDLSYKLVCRAKTICYTPKPLYFYRYNNTSILRGDFSVKRVDEYFVKKTMYEFYAEHFPNVSEYVYADLFFTGVRLYSMILDSSKELKEQYRFLITADKAILKRLMARENFSKKNKVQLMLFLISPSILVNIYSYKNLLKRKLQR